MNYDIFKGRWQPLRSVIQQKLDREAKDKSKDHRQHPRANPKTTKKRALECAQNIGDIWALGFRDGSWNFDATWAASSSGGSAGNPPSGAGVSGGGGRIESGEGVGRDGGDSKGDGTGSIGTYSLIFLKGHTYVVVSPLAILSHLLIDSEL